MIFSPLLPTTYPPSPISSKSQKREVSARIGKQVNVPTRIITANINITSGRHERCSQFPRASSPTTAALDSKRCRSRSAITRRISVSSFFFSRAGSVKRSITSPTELTIPPRVFFPRSYHHVLRVRES